MATKASATKVAEKERAEELKKASPAGMTYLLVTEAVEEWKKANPPDVIKVKTKQLLDRNSNEIVSKLLGFEQNYGGMWGIDHCNGRNGNSPIGVLLAQIKEDTIKEWLSTVVMPIFPEKSITAINKDCQHEFEYTFKVRLQELVKQHANKQAQAAFEQLKVTGILDNMDMLQKLLEE